ncbi:mCG1044721, partial [Mus musculus]
LNSEMETQNSAFIWVLVPHLVESGRINSTHLSLTKDSVSECFQKLS